MVYPLKQRPVKNFGNRPKKPQSEYDVNAKAKLPSMSSIIFPSCSPSARITKKLKSVARKTNDLLEDEAALLVTQIV